MVLHPKIQQLKNKVGVNPIRYSKTVKQPDAVRAQRSSTDDARLLKQYFAIWGVADDWGTMPIKGCFAKSISERGPGTKGTYKIPALYMHCQGDSVGLPSVLEEDEIGLYAEVPILEGVQVADELVIRHAKGVCNNGSYGFNYMWDKMEYDDDNDVVVMKETDLFELSFVTIGSQKGTYGVRNAAGIFVDETLDEETETLIRLLPRKHHLEIRSLIDRHISLAASQPLETRQTALEQSKPKQGIDYDFLISKLKN